MLLVIRKVLKKITLLRKIWFWIRFIKNNRYIPDFKNPKTYNEKINFRKRDPRNPLFSICADKVKAKEYVSDRISSEIIIPSYYVGDSIDLDQMKAIIAEYGDCFLKANHNSGAVYLLTTSSTESEIQAAVDSVSEQLKDDFGLLVNEPWYSNIQRKVLVEMRLRPSPGEVDIRDYKFHVFKQLDGGFKIILEVHYDQKWNHNISYFTEDLKWLPITIEYPNIVTQVEAPANYGVMLEYARKLAEPFSYVRVDFYNVNGAIYFGELTFAKTSGAAVFINRMYDLWLGNFWQGDPRI
ncbi:ATP-grasp fold amidoligase family protein [Stutzerimonas nitrititolerans]|uniref:ATP-grasp fold amidoligase family protein n=1 Tax=Stutzerimonas nitrititolerans TaxID=2482751 RepID=UPI002896E895|nr:ATP-grasp fold amidoligase family protein [Stutzerimonas nitrititolerans]